MAANALSTGYGHRDMAPVHWLERLTVYLALLPRKDLVDIWDDSRIGPGRQWRPEIARSLEQSTLLCALVLTVINMHFEYSSFRRHRVFLPLEGRSGR